MTDTPRSSKRRRLNDPSDGATSSPPSGALERLRSLRKKETPKTADSLPTSPFSRNHLGRQGNGDRHGRKSKTQDKVDVDDDIGEGSPSKQYSSRPEAQSDRRNNGVSVNGRIGQTVRNVDDTGDVRRRGRRNHDTADGEEDEIVKPPAHSTPSKPNGNLHADLTNDSTAQSVPTSTRPARAWPKQFTASYKAAQKLSAADLERTRTTPQRGLQQTSKFSTAKKQKSHSLVNGIQDAEEADSLTVAIPGDSPSIAVKSSTKAETPRSATVRDPAMLNGVKKIVLEKLTGRRPMPLIGLDEEYKKVYQVAEQTITSGEGNSMLLIGARGTGKTALINKVVKELARDNMSEFHVIRLNGFIHTNDKLALREIWRQLGREMEVEDDGTGKSYADTLAKLLALLSHPSELSGEQSDNIAKAVIFIMDEFDLFASHARQTLLYNLFDVAQSRKAPIAVFGLTTRIDVAESLEKRVKSRFSHRYVHLSLAKNLPMFQQICKTALTIQPNELTFEERALFAPPAPSSKKGKNKDTGGPFSAWNESIEALFRDSGFLSTFITPHFHLTKSVAAALTSLHLPTALADTATLPPKLSHFKPSGVADRSGASFTDIPNLTPPDSNLHLIPTLSSLSLALLIAAARCTIIHDTDVLNFRIAYAEYSSLASKARIQSASSGALAVGAGTGTRVWSRDVARGGWEELVKLGLLVPVLGGEEEGREVGEKGMVRVDVALEEILPSCPGMERVMEKWCKQI